MRVREERKGAGIMMVKGWSAQLSISSVNKQRKLSPKGRMDLA